MEILTQSEFDELPAGQYDANIIGVPPAGQKIKTKFHGDDYVVFMLGTMTGKKWFVDVAYFHDFPIWHKLPQDKNDPTATTASTPAEPEPEQTPSRHGS